MFKDLKRAKENVDRSFFKLVWKTEILAGYLITVDSCFKPVHNSSPTALEKNTIMCDMGCSLNCSDSNGAGHLSAINVNTGQILKGK